MIDYQIIRKQGDKWLPAILVSVTTIIGFGVCIISLMSGWTTIFQNLFYIPIIIACVYYTRWGLIFSAAIAGGYFALMALFSADAVILQGAFIRVLIFILVAAVITYLSEIHSKAEKALQESEEKYRRLFSLMRLMTDTMPDMLWAKNLKKEYIFVNKAICQNLLNAADTDEPVGKTDLFFATREREAHPNTPLWHTFGEMCRDSDAVTLQEQKPMQFDEFGIVKGEFLYLDVHKAPLFDEAGYPVGVVGSARDVTSRRQAEEALYASNQKLRLLTGLTRHDVINKLTAIPLFHDLASEESNPEKQKEYLRRASQASEEAKSIINFTKEYEDFGIVASGWQQVESLVMQASSEFVHRGIPIGTTIPPELQIFADPIIKKVFFTLIENAIRHGGVLARITFSCLKEGGSIIIVCEDDGCGIPDEEKERIFDHGYGKNTGLGLFLAREILAITGLSIRETGEPGRGARFEILVPEGKWRIAQEHAE